MIALQNRSSKPALFRTQCGPRETRAKSRATTAPVERRLVRIPSAHESSSWGDKAGRHSRGGAQLGSTSVCRWARSTRGPSRVAEIHPSGIAGADLVSRLLSAIELPDRPMSAHATRSCQRPLRDRESCLR